MYFPGGSVLIKVVSAEVEVPPASTTPSLTMLNTLSK